MHSIPDLGGPKDRDFEGSEIHNMLVMSVLESVQTEWASSVVFAQEKYRTLRFCIGYQKLNDVTVRDSYPLSVLDELIDSLADAQVFPTLDANSGYWRVEVDRSDGEKISFTSHHRLCQFT